MQNHNATNINNIIGNTNFQALRVPTGFLTKQASKHFECQRHSWLYKRHDIKDLKEITGNNVIKGTSLRMSTIFRAI